MGLGGTGFRGVLATVVVSCTGCLLAVGSAAGQPRHVAGSSVGGHTPTTTIWTPSMAPLPSSLPNGNAPASSILYSTSCSSSSFCAAVGFVQDSEQNDFPLVETMSGGTWTAAVAPLPSDAGTDSWNGFLYSVSCPVDGTCAAVGGFYAYDSANNTNYEEALIETLAGGRWTTTGAYIPGAQFDSNLSLKSVSCADATTCMAVGVGSTPTVGWYGAVYLFDGKSWTLQPQPPLPSSYQDNLDLAAVSCPDDTDCVVVGSYGEPGSPPAVPDTQYGLILTYSSGNWTPLEAPLPSNAAPAQEGAGLQVLDAVDCVDASDCVAGGAYFDTDPPEFQGYSGAQVPLIETLSGATWTASEGPYPSDAQSDPMAIIQGISCPALDACIADGSYWIDFAAGEQSGMLLTQSSSGWSVAQAPIPATSSASMKSAKHHTKRIAALEGISCVAAKTQVCRAVGRDGKRALVEATKRRK
jgi:hypothetical protein